VSKVTSALSGTFKDFIPQLTWWKRLVLVAVPLFSAGFAYFQSSAIWPAILGDEWVYSTNARHAPPGEPVIGATSNSIYNFVFSVTNLCGPEFYQCTKALNSLFFAVFVLMVFLVSLRFLPFWYSTALSLAAGVSSLSVYVSLFLPESMFYATIGVFIWLVVIGIEDWKPATWTLAGVTLGIASLVKPHAWFGLGALVIFGLVYIAFNIRDWRKILSLGLLVVVSAVIARITLALSLGSNDLLRIFGQYFDAGNIEEIVGGGGEDQAANPMASLLDFFPGMLLNQLGVVLSLVILPLMAAVSFFIRRGVRDLHGREANFLMLVLVWLGFMVIAVALFQSYVTAQGDDHALRVVLRYYEYLIPFLWIAALMGAKALSESGSSAWVRWTLVVTSGVILNWVFIDFYSTVQIQIADAPSVAGLIGSQLSTSLMWTIVPLVLLTFGVFPRFFAAAALASSVLISGALGQGTFEQYRIARGEQSAADRAGLYWAQSDFQDMTSEMVVIGQSRFDATLAAFWVDEGDIDFEIVPPGTYDLSTWPDELARYILVIGQDTVLTGGTVQHSGEGFTLYSKG